MPSAITKVITPTAARRCHRHCHYPRLMSSMPFLTRSLLKKLPTPIYHARKRFLTGVADFNPPRPRPTLTRSSLPKMVTFVTRLLHLSNVQLMHRTYCRPSSFNLKSCLHLHRYCLPLSFLLSPPSRKNCNRRKHQLKIVTLKNLRHKKRRRKRRRKARTKMG